MYRGKIFARCVYKNTNARDDMTMRCFFSGWMRLYRGKLFARLLYKITNACDDIDDVVRCFFFRMDAFVSFRRRHVSERCAPPVNGASVTAVS